MAPPPGTGAGGWAHLSGSSGRFAHNGIINETNVCVYGRVYLNKSETLLRVCACTYVCLCVCVCVVGRLSGRGVEEKKKKKWESKHRTHLLSRSYTRTHTLHEGTNRVNTFFRNEKERKRERERERERVSERKI